MDIRHRDTTSETILLGAEYEEVACNLCGGGSVSVLAQRDALGLPARTVMCRSCGLIFLNPRLTKQWYARYYARVDAVRRAYKHGTENPKEKLGVGFDAARRHGRALAERLKSFLLPGTTIDVGSAEGGLLAGMREVIPLNPIGIEPTVVRAEFATARGIPTHTGLVEDIKTIAPDLPEAANVVCTKSLNHFLDPRYFFLWAYDTLVSDGRLILEVKNFRQQCRMSGRIRAGIQIDHPFMFVPETLRAFVEAAGFDILFFEVDEQKSRAERQAQKQSGLPIGHIRLAARKTKRKPLSGSVALDPKRVHRLRFQFSQPALYAHYLVHYATPVQNLRKRLGIA